MPPKKIITKMQKIRDSKNPKIKTIYLNSVRFVFSILITGATYTTTAALFLWNNIVPPSESSFYQIQKQIAVIIIEMAKQSCKNYAFCDMTKLSFKITTVHP